MNKQEKVVTFLALLGASYLILRIAQGFLH